jgi:predicted phosphodiesterase
MKIGIVSDIHADARALRRALEHLPSADAYLCPGDAVSEYRFCADTVEVLQQANVLCIQGNHEQVLFNGRNPAYLKKCRETFAPEALDFLATAPLSRELEFGGTKVLEEGMPPVQRGRHGIVKHEVEIVRAERAS